MVRKKAMIDVEEKIWKDMKTIGIQTDKSVYDVVEEAFKNHIAKKKKEGIQIG